ncbi:MAG: lytic murein transglycosylase [Pseudoxanthomonas suwonensis]|nr:MAG: lytic murein transglycosylase [Pseudoxanthomonas suwonensis]
MPIPLRHLLLPLCCLLASACAPRSDTVAPPPQPEATDASAPSVHDGASDALLARALAAAEAGTFNATAFPGISTHPAYGWVEYAALRRNIDTLTPRQAGEFLSRYAGQPPGETFRSLWLTTLARRGDWTGFREAWPVDSDDPALRCSELTARASVGTVDAQWDADAQALWRDNGRSSPDACNAVFARLAQRGALTPALRWQRIERAAEEGQAGVMRSAANGLPKEEAALAHRYAAWIGKPDATAAQWPVSDRSRLVASHALARLARTSPDAAERLLPGIARALQFSEADRGRVLHAVALWTVASYKPESARRLAAVPASAYDERLHEWRVREAMSRSDWPGALAAIQAMPAEQAADSRWRYFHARLLEIAGQRDQAMPLYRQAAQAAEFHGFLAADRLQQPYALCPQPVDADPAMRRSVLVDAGVQRALALRRIDRRGWAEQEWKALVKRLTPQQRQHAVALAQGSGWFDRGVFGLVNVDGQRHADELRLYALRFPLHHDAVLRREAQRNRLDPAWVAAEIRAESIFDPKARSSADARGLMQILPTTGAEVAKRIGMAWQGGDSLYDSDTNIILGTAYLRQLMDQYQQKPYRVIAGYNAGPAPLNRWIGQRPAMDADFWIETISYKETRDYVARVLAFSVIYDWRLNGDALRLSDRLEGRVDGPRKAFACPADPAAAG